MAEFGDVKLPQRFWNKVAKAENGCWNWTGFRDKDGYGRFRVGSQKAGTARSAFAHRFAYETLVGLIPEGLEPDHTCHNPACVNPDHLEAVTHKLNCQRGLAGIATGKQMKAKTHCPKGHPYDEQNTGYKKNGSRYCKTCAHIGNKAWRDRQGGAVRGT